MDDAEPVSGPEGDAGVDAVAHRVLTDLAALPGVQRSALALVEGAGRRLRFTLSDRLGEVSPRWCLIDAYDDVPLTAVVRSGEPVLRDVEDLDPRYAAFAERQREQGIAAVAVVPVGVPGPPVGGIVVYFAESQAFDARQSRELAAAAQAVALRLEARRSPRGARDVAGEVPEGTLVATTVVDGDPRAARHARQFLRRELTAWQVEGALTDVAVLCASELVTNVVMHTGASSELEVSLDDSTLTLVVRDQGGPAHLAPGLVEDRDPLRVHGRGLQLVDALAHRWGSERDTIGTTVWVQLDRTGAG